MFSIETKLLIKMVYKNSYLEKFQKNYYLLLFLIQKKKVGFNASIHSLIDIKKNMNWLLAESRIFDIINREKFEQILKSDFTRNDYSKFLFSFISSKIFIDQNTKVN